MIHPVDYRPSQDFGDNPTKNLPASNWIIQQFGNYQPDGHTGVDYPCPVGTPVKAVAAGIVRHVGWMGGTYSDNPWWINPPFAGFHYVVDHGHFIGIYGHCMDGGARVVKGQRVAEGQVLGLSGNTGASTGPHLHFEVLPDGYILNSYMYGRIDPNSLSMGSITPQSATITPQAPVVVEQPKEWDEMASKEEIFEAVWGGPGVPLVHNYRLNRGEYPKTILGAFEARMQNEILAPLRAEIAAQGAALAGLVGALSAVNKGESFDETKLLEGVKSAAEAGVKNAISNIETTVVIKEG